MADNLSDILKTMPVRASGLSSWTDCPRRGAARMFKQQIADRGFSLRTSLPRFVSSAIGTAVHAGAEYVLRSKIDNVPFNIEMMIDMAVVKYREEIDDGVTYDQITGTGNDAERQIEIMCRAYFHGVAPDITPYATEMAFNVVLPNGMPLSGHPDVLCDIGIRDIKTGRSPEKYHIQLGIYNALVELHEGGQFPLTYVDWIPRVHVDKPYPGPTTITYNTAVCKAEAKAVAAQVQSQTEEFVKTSNPLTFPANPSSILCSDKYCPA
ncbi:MAG: PD-(D/E)XK nuclease family protein, partial [Candidatus Latescibacteria bacterium]|nr:PD-(D/E)XK nuclease family protein [Candidatus Latescibacterota bacterium]